MTDSSKVLRNFVMYILLFSSSRIFLCGATKECLVWRSTLKFVAKCPMTDEGILQASKRMKCETISQNCTDKLRFRYHCVPAVGKADFVEVCAEGIYSQGMCVAFDNHGKKLQELFNENCTSFVQPCPRRFFSSSLYKYKECYHQRVKNISITPVKYIPITPSSSDNIYGAKVFFGASLSFSILTIIPWIYLCIRKKRFHERIGKCWNIGCCRREDGDRKNNAINGDNDEFDVDAQTACLEKLPAVSPIEEAELYDRIDNLSICMSSISNTGFSKESFDELVKHFDLHQLENTLTTNGVDCLRTFVALSQKDLEGFGFNVGQQRKCLETIDQIRRKALNSSGMSSQTSRKSFAVL